MVSRPKWQCHSSLGTPYRFIFYDDLHFAAVCRHIVQDELYLSIHIGYTKVAICSVGIKTLFKILYYAAKTLCLHYIINRIYEIR